MPVSTRRRVLPDSDVDVRAEVQSGKLDFDPPRVVRKVGWLNCVGCGNSFFSELDSHAQTVKVLSV